MPLASRLALLLLLWLPGCASAPDPDAEADVKAALESFYGAMKQGDASAAMTLVAPDAVFVESGRLETRDEYEQNHLPADIAFEKQVNGRRGPMQVRIEGDVAWVIATTDFQGVFDGSPVDFVSAQLAVLSRVDQRWLIRSVHWSSQRR
jgi:ketosteroid isomerase-like protein